MTPTTRSWTACRAENVFRLAILSTMYPSGVLQGPRSSPDPRRAGGPARAPARWGGGRASGSGARPKRPLRDYRYNCRLRRRKGSAEMTYPYPTSFLNVDLQPGKPPILRVSATGDPARWAAEHRNALRTLAAEHGSLLVRGLGLRDAAEAGAVFRQLGSLMTEREAFAPRRRYAQGVYSSSKWPPNQPMCMHHELSYALEPPSLMLFACLTAVASGGATPEAGTPAVLDALPPDLVDPVDRSGELRDRPPTACLRGSAPARLGAAS